MFDWKSTKRPIVALAPMAGVTDASYRQFIKKIAPEAIVFTEFLSTDAIHFGAEKTLKMLEFDPEIEKPFIVQVFGNKRDHFISACKVIEEMGADGIDINMGCPAAKVVSSCHGSALIRRVDLAMDVVDAAVNAVKIPVSVKTRLGWESSDELIPFCQKLVEAGASALTIHGRTYKQKFTGEADWNPIYELKRSISVPVIGNGDVWSAEDALEKLQNLDGVMIGRGTMGNPWVMREVIDALDKSCEFLVFSSDEESETKNSQRKTRNSIPTTLKEKIPYLLMHCELAVKHKGEKRGITEMRKHFGGYVRGFDGAKEMRMKLMETERLCDVEKILSEASR